MGVHMLSCSRLQLSAVLVGLVTVLAGSPAEAVCYTCEPEPIDSCTPGETRSCTVTSAGSDYKCPYGTQTCTSLKKWGSCTDSSNQCWRRTGCPVNRQTVFTWNGKTAVASHEKAIGKLVKGTTVCTDAFVARWGEQIHVRANLEKNQNQLRLVTTTGKVLRTVDNDYWPQIDYHVPVNGLSYKACVVNTSTTDFAVRFTLDIAGQRSDGKVCSSRVDLCMGAHGPQCTNCDQASPTENMKRYCAVTVGSNRHDTCCMYYPGGKFCGNINADNYKVYDQYCEDIAGCAPPPGYWGSYQMCTAEFDRGARDNTWNYIWRQWVDGTAVSYVPADFAQQDRSGHWMNGIPTSHSLKAPAGQKIDQLDADLGWCANGASTNPCQ